MPYVQFTPVFRVETVPIPLRYVFQVKTTMVSFAAFDGSLEVLNYVLALLGDKFDTRNKVRFA